MKRHQIRKLIPGNAISDAQLRQAIADLGLPTDDGHDYDAEQVRAIIDQFKPAAPAAEQPPAPPQTDASQALALTKGAIAASTSNLQQQALSFANRIQTGDRALAKQLAGFLKDRPNRFAVMLAEEIHALTETAESPDFIDVSWGESPSLELPTVALPATAFGGALPAAY